ncbi:MAG TPA: penicillin acylase family protein, partial [Candidatus Dormibacteraeota bacterium]
QQVYADAQGYVDGVNQYITEALADPNKLPAEYPALQEVPAPWKLTDIVAVATLVQAIFAVGGGDEVDSALLYETLTQRYGTTKGAAIWHDLRSQNDPEAIVTIPQSFPYQQVTSVNPAAIAMPTGRPQSSFCDGGPPPAANPGLGQIAVGPVAVDLSFVLSPNHHASNALLLGAGATATGHPVAVFGPQTGYLDPQILHEEDLHGPGISARGAAFPGTEVYVELGRGPDYAWSATSAGADIIDQRAERLCNPDGSPATLQSTSYLFNGKCTPMYERTDRQVAKTSAGGPNPPSVVTIQIERTVHGPVVGRTTAIDPATGTPVPVAISAQRSTWFDELGAVAAFLNWNDPDVIRSAHDFQLAAGKETGTFNWFYVDSKDIAYYMSGRLPVRASGVDPNFPSWGTGRWEWQGFAPANLSSSDPHPRAVDPPAGFMANWNNKPAPGFSAADSNFAYGPVYRSQSLSDRLQALVSRGGAQPVDVVNAMEDAATVDLDGSQLVKQMEAVLAGAPMTVQQSQVLSILDAWASAGAHRRDRSGSGAYEQGNAVAIMDQLYPRLTHAVFDPWLGSAGYGELTSLLPINNPPGARGSAYDGGWEGYLQRSFRQAVNPAIANPYSQSYCGSGSLGACQQALIAAIQGSIDALTSAYHSSDPNAWTCARRNTGSGQCNPAADDIQFQVVGVASVPNIPWQNRPTFQQVVQYGAHL